MRFFSFVENSSVFMYGQSCTSQCCKGCQQRLNGTEMAFRFFCESCSADSREKLQFWLGLFPSPTLGADSALRDPVAVHVKVLRTGQYLCGISSEY